MIAFDIQCSNGHIFEGWFNNSDSFEEQNIKNMINCPYCNDSEIKKVLSPVAMKSSARPEVLNEGEPIDYKKLAKAVVEYVDKNFENVGPDFMKEALKIHYGVTEKRNIRGSATKEDEDLLEKEGVEYFKIPVPKTEDKN